MKTLLISATLSLFGAAGASAQEVAFYAQQSGSSERGLLLVDSEGAERFFGLNALLGEQPGEAAVLNFDPTSGLYYVLVDPSNANGAAGYTLITIDPTTGEQTLFGNFNSSGSFFPLIANSPPILNMQGLGAGSGLRSDFQEAIESSSAVASALEIQLPVNGAANRIGLTSGAFGDEQAFGVSYARVEGRFDVGLAYAQGDGGRNAGKVSVGFSW